MHRRSGSGSGRLSMLSQSPCVPILRTNSAKAACSFCCLREIFINRTISRKQQNEQAAFAEFVRRMGTHGDWLSIDSRPEPEPDLLCIHVDGPVAFELVSLTDSVIAKVQAAGPKAYQDAFYTSDPAEEIIRKKLRKKY